MKAIILSILFCCFHIKFIHAQVFFNEQDSLYYVDSTFTKVGNGEIAFYNDKYFDDTDFWIEGDSIVLVLKKGTLRSKAAFDRNDKYQKFKYYYKNNRIVDGVYDEIVRTYYKEKKIYVETVYRYSYVNGKEDGVFYEFNRSNPEFKKTIGSFKEGKMHGYIVQFKPNGLLFEESMFKNGKKDGFERTYFEDTNQLRYSRQYKDGYEHGQFKTFWKNGQLLVVLNYEYGQLQGLLKAYLENGELAFIQHYENGELIKTELYKENLPDFFTNGILRDPDYTQAQIVKKY